MGFAEERSRERMRVKSRSERVYISKEYNSASPSVVLSLRAVYATQLLFITLPQIRLPYEFPVGGKDIHNRTTLAFWATAAAAWPTHPQKERFRTSKYCICHGESFLTRICITDSIYFGCVPVISHDNYELPFNDILDWTKFSVRIAEDYIYVVEQILEDISDSEFSDLHYNIVKVQRHFEWNSPPRKYDAFHMILYELWLRHLSISDDLSDF
ncbi:probable glycosyltransferase At3g42180 [Tripterygium wilfordii]|uniref:probable glycosyltransferase At3g42180 n=1 Tax=Tripterygium wilfordii TaxID=458696 RepID=UPI0018F833FC|nr:probable glycosyltransferase At3g42180 [Tripterygium wilfordii]